MSGQEAIARPTALITGGSRGIGREVARRLAADGYRLALLARTDADLDRAAREMETAEGEVIRLAADVADPDAVRNAFGEAVRSLGRLDVVVHCAGVLATGRFDEIDVDDYRSLCEINYLGAVHVAREAIPRLLAGGGGHLVQVASVIAIRTFPGFAAYAPTKAALQAFHQTLELELAGTPLRLSLVYPPITDTPMVRDLPSSTRPAVYDAFAAVPAEKVAAAIVRGIRRGRRRIFARTEDRFYFHLARVAPASVGRVLDWYVRRSPRRPVRKDGA